MITQLAVAVALVAGPGPVSQPDSAQVPVSDPWVSPDKAKHFLIAGFVESASFAGLEVGGISRKGAFIGALAITGAVSVFREVHGKRARNQFSYRDLAWDVAGGVAAFIMLRHTERP